METFQEIRCVKRDKGFVVSICGTFAPISSNGVPTEGSLNAVEGAKGSVDYLHPKHCKLFVQFITAGTENTKCFFIADPEDASNNLLDDFDEC